jgi:hypothetical protein
MEDMLKNNEDMHLASSTSTERERLEREIMAASAPPETAPARADRRIAAPASGRKSPRISTPQAERSPMPSLTSAPVTSQQAQTQSHDSGVPGNKRLDLRGSATLIAKGGGEIGTLDIALET